VPDEPNNPMNDPLASLQDGAADAGVGQQGPPPDPEAHESTARELSGPQPDLREEGADPFDDEDDLLEAIPEPDASEAQTESQPSLEAPAEERSSEMHGPEADVAAQPSRAEAIEEKAPEEKAPEEASPDEKAAAEQPKSDKMDWYILKVQSNREESIKEGLLRRVAIHRLDHYFGDVIVPTEKVTEFKGGKKRVTKRKLYPGYIVVNMEINEDTWFLVRETPGIGDFTGAAGTPTPMLPHEVNRILARQEEKSDEAPKLKINFSVGDRVKINEGTFENFEGEVDSIDQTNGRVTVMINIFGRSTPVALEYWQIAAS